MERGINCNSAVDVLIILLWRKNVDARWTHRVRTECCGFESRLRTCWVREAGMQKAVKGYTKLTGSTDKIGQSNPSQQFSLDYGEAACLPVYIYNNRGLIMKNMLMGEMQEIPESISVMAYVDPVGEVSDEYAKIKERIKAILPEIPKIIFKVVVFDDSEKKIGISTTEFFDGKADLYIYDYGGMSGMGSDFLVQSNHEDLAKKIENEPGRLFILWSEFTSDSFWDQIRIESSWLLRANNILTINDDPNKFDHKVASWFGLKRKPICNFSKVGRGGGNLDGEFLSVMACVQECLSILDMKEEQSAFTKMAQSVWRSTKTMDSLKGVVATFVTIENWDGGK